MSLKGRYKINPKVTHETIDGEAVIVNLYNGNYYSLDKVGADVWGLIEMNNNISEIIDEIAVHYDCDIGEIKKSIAQLISDLKKEALIRFYKVWLMLYRLFVMFNCRV